MTVASKNIAVMLDVAVSVLVSKLAPPWEFPLQISQHLRIYPILPSRTCFIHSSAHEPRESQRARSHARLNSFLPFSGFLTSSSSSQGETAAVNGANVPPFPRDHGGGEGEMGTMVPLVPGTSWKLEPRPLSPSARVPRSDPPNGRSSIPWNRKLCPKVSRAFPRVRTTEQRRSHGGTAAAAAKNALRACAFLSSRQSVCLHLPLVSPCRTDQ